MDILNELGKRILFFDGGLGTMIQERGLKVGELPETWNLKFPEILTEIHSSFLEAGADIICANTFGINRLKHGEQVGELVSAGVRNAKMAVKNCGKTAWVALDIGPTGKLLKPLGTLDFEEAVEIFAEVMRAGEAAGADLIIIETMSDIYELKAAVLAAKENSALPLMATAVFGENGKMLTGSSPAGMAALLEGMGVDALGINCGLGPKQMKAVMKELMESASIPVIVNPNAGLPRSENGKTVFDVSPEEFAADMEDMVNMGALLVGGCCGTTPAHIAALTERCKDMPPKPLVPKNRTFVSSYSRITELGREPVIIGERINPTGKPKFKQALLENNMDYILQEAVNQADAGAHILDVNVGLPDIDEPTMMRRAVTQIQEISPLPLQIDTSNIEAMEQAMRIYNGKPMVNSVNGKAEVMHAVFPLVKKYGGVVVGLTLDEDGIPETAEGRLAIAEKIYKTAESYGIARKDIVIDALTMTMSTNQSSAKVTLDTVREITKQGGRTVLGVSNISFGLPQRKLVNASFFTLALEAGLSAGIINPNVPEMMQAYDSFLLLNGLDDRCASYIGKYSESGAAPTPTASVPEKLSLSDCIIKGLKDRAFHSACEALETREPMEIISGELVPALDTVGAGFEKGAMFLPQLLMSAEAAGAAFEAIKQHLQKAGIQREPKGTVVLATVEGDIHDIGKNIVRALLENYGYEILDLGKNVPPEAVVEAVVQTHAPIVGLSALMTTTVPSMEKTIALLRREAPWCKIMVGGAVLTQEYAEKIGADFYGKDAMQAVAYVERLLNNQ